MQRVNVKEWGVLHKRILAAAQQNRSEEVAEGLRRLQSAMNAPYKNYWGHLLDRTLVAWISTMPPTPDNAYEFTRRSAFLLACQQGHLETVGVVLERGLDINDQTVSPFGLFCAVSRNRLELTRLLLDRGADINRDAPK